MTIDKPNALRPTHQCYDFSLRVFEGSFDCLIFEVLLFMVKLKREYRIVVWLLILLDLDKEHPFFREHYILIVFVDFDGFDDFNHIAYLRIDLIQILIASTILFLFLLFDFLFNVKRGCYHVARWLEDLDSATFTSQDGIVLRVGMVVYNLEDGNVKTHQRLVIVPN